MSNNTLTERQGKILTILNSSENYYVSIEKLKEIFSVGEKSIYNDITAINKENFGGIVDRKNNGYQLKIFNTEKKTSYFNNLAESLKYSRFSDSDTRPNVILCMLLKSNNYVRSTTIQNKLFISKSTLTSDLAHVRKTLNDYNLTLEVKPHYGLSVIGDEKNIRKLIVQKLAHIYLSEEEGFAHVVHTQNISVILANTLLKYHFKVSDIIFQNLIIHIATALQRMKYSNTLPSNKELPLIYYHALTISKEIFQRCSKEFGVEYNEEEAKELAIELQCKRDFEESTSINEEINSFVMDTLTIIKSKMYVDLTGDLDLRISLALHTNPLINRLRNNIQLANSLTMDVKTKFPLAYDIATQYAHRINIVYSLTANEDEITYLSLHFIASLKKQERAKNQHKILLICEQRKSNTILIQQQLISWFNDDVSSVNVINILEIDMTDLSEYDVIITTDENTLSKIDNAVLINLFPNEKDRTKIEMAFDGLTKGSDVINHFSKDLFFYGDINNKEEAINILCTKAKQHFNLDDSFSESVWLHESFANTFFGNHIAMPHPDSYITDESFVCVCIPKKPIRWDQETDIQLVLLVSIKKNDPKAPRIWQYLSFLITDDSLLRKIVSNPTYDNLINTLSDFYRNLLDK